MQKFDFMTISQQTFPGVYTSIKDDSFLTNVVSRFRCGLVGVAAKGPMDTVVNARSLKEFRRVFGASISGNFLANAVAAVSDYTDGVSVVRVGRQYSRVAGAAEATIFGGSGGSGGGANAYKIYTPKAKLINVGDYIRITQGGMITTTNAKVIDYIPPGDQANATGVQLLDSGVESVPLADVYTSATIDRATDTGATSNAEAFLYAYEYTTPMTILGAASGDKNSLSFTVGGTVLPTVISSISIFSGTTAQAITAGNHNLETGNTINISGAVPAGYNGTDLVVTRVNATTFRYSVASSLAPASTPGSFVPLASGDVIRITEATRTSTLDARVREVRADGFILLEPANLSQVGYQALALQDTYTTATVSKVKKNSDGSPVLHRAVHLIAASPGTWANSNGSSTGLIVRVAPGSAPGTKKLLVYEDSVLVESIDGLSSDPNSADYYVTRINGNSAAIAITTDDAGVETGIIAQPSGVDVGTFQAPANTTDPWDLTAGHKVNVAAFGSTVSEFSGGVQVSKNLAQGFNGESPLPEDVIGTINPDTDEGTGLRLFLDTDAVQVNVLCVPGATTLAVHQELAFIANKINAIAFADIPDITDGIINPRLAVDWHNGAGLFSNRSRINSRNLVLFFNWFKLVDPFTSTQIWAPPTLAALRATARAFDRNKPWTSFAGENYGVIEEALAVRFPKISLETKSSMYGNGNSVNPILLYRGRIMVYGDRTMQVAESKLTAAHSVILTNYIVNSMAAISRRFVFDPNDSELILELDGALRKFMESVKSERGVEDFSLLVTATAQDRNLRQVIVSVDFIPIDLVERIYINATVRESGAVLNSIQ
jgi:hypothetical protein